MVTVSEATDADAEDWDRFVRAKSSGSFYHLYGWRAINRDCFAHESSFRIARQAREIVGVLPLVLVASRPFGRIVCSVPFMNYGGPCAEPGVVETALLDDAVRRSRELRADYLELRCAAKLESALPVSIRKVSMTVATGPDPEVLWNAFTPKHRKNVRRAFKNGLEVRSGGLDLLAQFYSVLECSWRDLGTPLYSIDYFRTILGAFPDRTRIYICSQDGSAISVAMVGFHGRKAEGLWQGGLPRARELDANYVLYWEMIRDICLRGCSEFHLGRSTAESGSEWFKSRWNAEVQQLYWYFHRPDGGSMPALNVDNPRYRLAIAVWRRLPLWLTRRLGPAIARGIP